MIIQQSHFKITLFALLLIYCKIENKSDKVNIGNKG